MFRNLVAVYVRGDVKMMNEAVKRDLQRQEASLLSADTRE